jgi:Domain of unknown function (DUF1937)
MFIYLASPYSAPTPGERHTRFVKACKKAAALMEDGHVVFCPIAHSHSIEVEGMDEIHDGKFWLRQDFAILDCVDVLFVYMMDGWEESKGIKAEIAYAKAENIPVYYIGENDFGPSEATVYGASATDSYKRPAAQQQAMG